MEQIIKVLFSAQEISTRILELGHDISKFYYKSSNKVILVGLLRGSFVFIADLCRAISIAHEVDFMITSSYGNSMSSNKDVKILKDLEEDIYGKDVLIVEDIIDSGNTLSLVNHILALRQPKSLSICTLLDKPKRREINVIVNWVGFTIPDEFVVGYGIDYAQMYRHLPFLGKIVNTKNYKSTK